jgi:intracellular sulfur oxidation DsrE/DsrF family protein
MVLIKKTNSQNLSEDSLLKFRRIAKSGVIEVIKME